MTAQTFWGLASLLLLLCAFCGLGLAVLQALRVRITSLDGVYALAAGWGALVALSVPAVYAAVPLRHVLYAGLIVGWGALARSLWRGAGLPPLKCLGVGLLAILPAILAAASFSSVQYDEFAHWLPNAFYLYSNDTLPSAGLPNLQTGKQGYPIGTPYVTFAVSAIEGAWDDRTPKVLSLALGAFFGVLIAGALTRTDWPAAPAVAVGALAGTLLNPFFDPRVAITTYSDVPTAFVLAAMLYALWRAGESPEAARDWTIRASLAALVLVQLRETNIALVAAAALAVPAAAAVVRDPRAIGLRRSWSVAAAFTAAPAAAFLIWRLHLQAQDIAQDVTPRALGNWNWSAMATVLRSLATERLANNPLMGTSAFAIGLTLAVGGVLRWRHLSAGTRRLGVTVAMLAGAQAALLAFSYTAVFSEEEVQRAASAWRYASHLGPFLILAAAHVLGHWRLAWPGVPQAGRFGRHASPALVVGAVVALQLLCAGRWRIDCVYPHVRPGYDALVALLAKIPSQAPTVIVSTADSQLFSEAARLARVVASGDWRAQPVLVVESDEARTPAAYVIDISGADPNRFGSGHAFLHATTHVGRLAAPAIDAVTVATTCPAG
jgi:hypothetical protein